MLFKLCYGQEETDKEEHGGQQHFLRGQEWFTSGVRRVANKIKFDCGRFPGALTKHGDAICVRDGAREGAREGARSGADNICLVVPSVGAYTYIMY